MNKVLLSCLIFFAFMNQPDALSKSMLGQKNSISNLEFLEKEIHSWGEKGDEERVAFNLAELASIDIMLIPDKLDNLKHHLQNQNKILSLRKTHPGFLQEEEIGIVYANIATIMKYMGSLDKSLAYYEKAMQIFQELESLGGDLYNKERKRYVILLSIGEIYKKMGDLEKAFELEKKAYNIYQDKVNRIKQSGIPPNRLYIYVRKKDDSLLCINEIYEFSITIPGEWDVGIPRGKDRLFTAANRTKKAGVSIRYTKQPFTGNQKSFLKHVDEKFGLVQIIDSANPPILVTEHKDEYSWWTKTGWVLNGRDLFWIDCSSTESNLYPLFEEEFNQIIASFKLSEVAKFPTKARDMANRLFDLAMEKAKQSDKEQRENEKKEDLQEAAAYWEQSLELYRIIGDKGKEAVNLYVLGRAYRDLSDKQTSLKDYQKALEMYHEIGDRDNVLKIIGEMLSTATNREERFAIFSMNRAVMNQQFLEKMIADLDSYVKRGSYQVAILGLEIALDLSVYIDNPVYMYNILLRKGDVYKARGDHERSLEPLQEALDIAEKHFGRTSAYAALVHNMIGSVYLQIPQLEKAIEHFSRSLSIFLKKGYKKAQASLYNDMGIAYRNMGDYQKAMECHLKSLEICEVVFDKLTLARNLTNLANIYTRQEEYEKAQKTYKEALEAHQQAENKLGEGKTYFWIGHLYSRLKEHEKALGNYRNAQRIFSQLGKTDVAEATSNYINEELAFILITVANNEKMDKLLRQYKELTDTSFIHWLITYANRSEHFGTEYSLSRVELAEKISRLKRDSKSLAFAYSGKAKILSHAGNFPESIENLKTALKMFQLENNIDGMADCHLDLGAIFLIQGIQTIAEGYFQKALKLYEQSQNEIGKGDAYRHLGIVYRWFGDFKAAMEKQQKALKIYAKVGNQSTKFEEARVYTEMGLISERQGSYQQALGFNQKALKIYQETGDLLGKANSLGNIGNVYGMLNDPEKALSYQKKALRLHETIGSKLNIAIDYSDIASTYVKLGNYTNALINGLGALEKYAEMEVPRGIAYSYLLIGKINRKSGQRKGIEEAIKNYQKALEIFQSIGNKDILALCRIRLGNAYEDLQDYQGAKKHYQEALRLAQETSSDEFIWVAQYKLGSLTLMSSDTVESGEIDEAIIHYKAAIETIESLRSKSSAEWAKIAVFEDKLLVYEKIVALLMENDKMQQAYHYAERMKARAFLDILQDSNIKVKAGIPLEIREQEQSLQSAIVAKENLILHSLNEHLKQQWLEERDALQREFDGFQLKLRENYPRYAEFKYPSPLTFEQVREEVIKEDEVLLEYLLCDQGTYLWVISKELNHPLTYRLRSRKQLEESVRKYRTTLTQPFQQELVNFEGNKHKKDSTAEHDQLGWKLYTDLLRPLMKEHPTLLKNKTLVIIPDGILYYLPFETLITTPPSVERAEYLIQKDYPIIYAPSASALGYIRRNKARKNVETVKPYKSIIAFGDPVYDREDLKAERQKQTKTSTNLVIQAQVASKEIPLQREDSDYKFPRLRYTADEIKEIMENYADALIYLRLTATEEAVKNCHLEDFKYIHFATHAVLNEQAPRLSAVILTQDEDDTEDGFLTMGEILNFKLSADMVVLSACQTGLGRRVKGEGIIGLTRAFQYAGTPSLVVSLWRVSDPSTASLMKRFYRHLNKGMAKAEALRKAKQWVIKYSYHKTKSGDPIRHSHPYYWAPFILVGISK